MIGLYRDPIIRDLRGSRVVPPLPRMRALPVITVIKTKYVLHHTNTTRRSCISPLGRFTPTKMHTYRHGDDL